MDGCACFCDFQLSQMKDDECETIYFWLWLLNLALRHSVKEVKKTAVVTVLQPKIQEMFIVNPIYKK